MGAFSDKGIADFGRHFHATVSGAPSIPKQMVGTVMFDETLSLEDITSSVETMHQRLRNMVGTMAPESLEAMLSEASTHENGSVSVKFSMPEHKNFGAIELMRAIAPDVTEPDEYAV